MEKERGRRVTRGIGKEEETGREEMVKRKSEGEAKQEERRERETRQEELEEKETKREYKNR